MDLIGGIRWRYQYYVGSYRNIHRGPISQCRQWIANKQALRAPKPMAYVFADPSNSGDYASHLGLKYLVGSCGVSLFCAPDAVSTTLKRLSTSPRPGAKWQVVWVGGGGLFQQCFDQFWRGLLETRVPFVVFGVGANQAGDYRSITPRSLLSAIAKQALAIHVRDKFTQQLFTPYRESPVTIGICPSVHYVCEAAQHLQRTTTHLFHVVHRADMAMSGVELNDQRKALRYIAKSLDLGYDESDHLNGMGRGLLQRYARAAVVVSSRLHGCIFSYAMDKPFLAISCDRKVDSFLETHASDNPRLSVRGAAASLTKDLVANVISRKPSLRRSSEMLNNINEMKRITALVEK